MDVDDWIVIRTNRVGGVGMEYESDILGQISNRL